jgi:hypothetical protein
MDRKEERRRALHLSVLVLFFFFFVTARLPSADERNEEAHRHAHTHTQKKQMLQTPVSLFSVPGTAIQESKADFFLSRFLLHYTLPSVQQQPPKKDD